MFGSGQFAAELKRNAPAIDRILRYASSPGNADILADHLAGDLAAYSSRFMPGKKIDEQILGRRAWKPAYEHPDYGRGVQAYLLIENARLRRSTALTRKALVALDNAMLAASNLGTQAFLYHYPQMREELVRGQREHGGMITTLGAEIAWCCERFMTQMYLSDASWLPPSAMSILKQYWQWRKGVLSTEPGAGGMLAPSYQHRTMEYVRKLVRALPSDP
jgi:hypothetical protein